MSASSHNTRPDSQQVLAIRRRLTEILAGQPLAVLATCQQGQPYCSLVAVAAEADFTGLLLATPRDSQKYLNIQAEPRVSLLIDNRSHRPRDFQHAAAVTALGPAAEVDKSARADLLEQYIAVQPNLENFVRSAETALVRVAVRRYVVVRHFQDVVEFVPTEA